MARAWCTPIGQWYSQLQTPFASLITWKLYPLLCANWLHRFRKRFVTWDDGIGTHPQNPHCFCIYPSRQDRKGTEARVKGFGEGFWVCASGACHYFSDRKDGLSWEDARKLFDYFDDFVPNLLVKVPF